MLNQSPTAYHGRGHNHGVVDVDIGADGGAVADNSKRLEPRSLRGQRCDEAAST